MTFIVLLVVSSHGELTRTQSILSWILWTFLRYSNACSDSLELNPTSGLSLSPLPLSCPLLSSGSIRPRLAELGQEKLPAHIVRAGRQEEEEEDTHKDNVCVCEHTYMLSQDHQRSTPPCQKGSPGTYLPAFLTALIIYLCWGDQKRRTTIPYLFLHISNTQITTSSHHLRVIKTASLFSRLQVTTTKSHCICRIGWASWNWH